MVTGRSFVQLFTGKGLSGSKATEAAHRLISDCPWLLSGEEISEEIGSDLIKEAVDPSILLLVSADELIAWHNGSIRMGRAVGADKNSAYSSLRSLVAGFGVESAFGDGDYWVVSDSFSTEKAIVVKFGEPILRSDLKASMDDWLNSQEAMSSISVMTQEGDAIFFIERREVRR